MTRTRAITTAIGLLVGVGSLLLWIQHNPLAVEPSQIRWPLLLLGMLGLPIMVGLQTIRTALWFGGRDRLGVVVRPVLTAHAINTFLPTAGDLWEVLALSAGLGETKAATLKILVFRMAVTVSSLCLVGGLGLTLRVPAAGATLMVVGVGVVGGLALYLRQTLPLTDAVLALAQLAAEACGLAAIAAAVGPAMGLYVATGAISMVELVSYVPVPLASLGLTHWSIVGAAALIDPSLPGPATATALHHGWQVAVGAVAAVAFLWSAPVEGS